MADRRDQLKEMHDKCVRDLMSRMTHRETSCAAIALATGLLQENQLEEMAWSIGNPESRRAVLKLGKSMHEHAVQETGSVEKMSPCEDATPQEMRDWIASRMAERMGAERIAWAVLVLIAALEALGQFERSLANTIMDKKMFDAWNDILDITDEVTQRWQTRN